MKKICSMLAISTLFVPSAIYASSNPAYTACMNSALYNYYTKIAQCNAMQDYNQASSCKSDASMRLGLEQQICKKSL